MIGYFLQMWYTFNSGNQHSAERGRIWKGADTKMEGYHTFGQENTLWQKHILIVEDDKDIREGIEIYLRNQGYVVFQAADGIEGLNVVEKEEIHLAIVDIMMPRMDGVTMLMKMRKKDMIFRSSCCLPSLRK